MEFKLNRGIHSQFHVLLVSFTAFLFSYSHFLSLGSMDGVKKVLFIVSIIMYIMYHVYPKSFKISSRILTIILGFTFGVIMAFVTTVALSDNINLLGMFDLIYLLLIIGSTFLTLFKWRSINILLEFVLFISLTYYFASSRYLRYYTEFIFTLSCFIINTLYLLFLIIYRLKHRKVNRIVDS